MNIFVRESQISKFSMATRKIKGTVAQDSRGWHHDERRAEGHARTLRRGAPR